MPLFANPLSLRKIALAWMVAAQMVVVATAGLARAAWSQNSSDPATPPRPVLHNPVPADQLAFMNAYAGRAAKDLEKEKAYGHVVKDVVPRTTYHYGRDMPLSEAVDAALSGSKQPVMLRDGRYLTVNGERGPYLSGRGFLWFDLQDGTALGAFYFTPTNGEPSPTLTVFSKQLTAGAMAMSDLPQAFVQDLYQWEAIARVPPVSPRYFIPANGKKYVLVHDEDYCWHPENSPAPDQNVCEKMNAQAADVDLSAAYFMKETGNAANATAWMLGPEQVAWLALRDKSCGPNGLACRIRMTRERTWMLMGGTPRPVRPRPQEASR
ncbi:MAG TPA: lysozyme inhibitor LprI family protein [Terracidiphilus sp.]|jgi:uncharacterized protein YecT (DUF1311 family)|nr:lysozyme inhibitor LprI family protein [Terracidiphilus sp.]